MRTLASLADILAPHRGITAVIGSGGKSTLLARGALSLAERGARVALATSTHMLPPAGVPLVRTAKELRAALAAHPVVAIGELDRATGKLSSPACGFDELTTCADYALVEADGSHRLPLKAHASYEPVMPKGATRTVMVVGASGFNHPLSKVVHRPEIFCQVTDADPACLAALATPELVARAIAREGLLTAGDAAIVNQAEDAETRLAAETFAEALFSLIPVTIYIGSIRSQTFSVHPAR